MSPEGKNFLSFHCKICAQLGALVFSQFLIVEGMGEGGWCRHCWSGIHAVHLTTLHLENLTWPIGTESHNFFSCKICPCPVNFVCAAGLKFSELFCLFLWAFLDLSSVINSGLK